MENTGYGLRKEYAEKEGRFEPGRCGNFSSAYVEWLEQTVTANRIINKQLRDKLIPSGHEQAAVTKDGNFEKEE